ncbi:MAG: CoA pyrophosphatase [candidate division KSB1 bacterium]|nr:CoA pyrophosphatase [candidate division KSB1 bacterium]MDZ7305192.1 CoA pyrophosphatase [candidate division KSB1 bacterium]MDZ7314287.1 CoA pyrophosphatase [candidate division KSB1 bacterium]
MLLDPNRIVELLQRFRGRFVANRRLKASAIMMILFNSSPSRTAELQTHILLIERARDYSRHSGQIAFPGGKIEALDSSPLEAALRETKEEIGIDRGQLMLLGSMGFFRTLTSGFDASVHLGWAVQPLSWKPRQQEVASVLEIPLADLYAQFKPGLLLHRRVDLMNLHFHWQIPDSQRQVCIWGLTARVLHCFFQMLQIEQGEYNI